jgi:hypothetical protein
VLNIQHPSRNVQGGRKKIDFDVEKIDNGDSYLGLANG